MILEAARPGDHRRAAVGGARGVVLAALQLAEDEAPEAIGDAAELAAEAVLENDLRAGLRARDRDHRDARLDLDR